MYSQTYIHTYILTSQSTLSMTLSSSFKALGIWVLSYLVPTILPPRSHQRLSGVLRLTGDQFVTIQSQDMKIIVGGNDITIHTSHPLSIDVNGVGSDSPSDDIDLNERIRKITPIPICD